MIELKPYKEPKLSILILDYLREKESDILLDSLDRFLKFKPKIIYLSNSPECNYAKKYLDDGRIDQLIINKENLGCGIATRQLFHASLSPFSLYLQNDQYLIKEFTEEYFEYLVNYCLRDNFYIDLAGNQGHGKFSERAFLIETRKYLNIPNIESVCGSPGPYANETWGEKFIQDYMQLNRLKFASTYLFADNGKISRRSYPCGGETIHYTDEKRVFIVKPLKQRYDNFPNLKWTDQEWEMVLSGNAPKEGFIPEGDKKHSFIYWRD